jgi:ferritin
MLKPVIEQALNAQLNQEQGAAHEYLAAAAWFAERNLNGFATFMRNQALEEREHAMKIFDYLLDRGGHITLDAIARPSGDFQSPRSAFDAAYKREQANTASIHELYRLATEQGDYATQTMLHWFIEEQVEEEAWCEEAVALFETIGDNPSALLMLDSRYGNKAAAEG